ncbi:cache domain-containing protein [Rhizobium oryzicola]|uniref:Cache domain-containing protein n=1 Tax=Rhizobium oryzicola TaxID=1232668 RepID=A0ABT8T2S7_9HYPH|nr:cache domain-containing protein [Rhizobium oryzicola]MDO1585059.1 cache domain-containing protein [Rhizobium oryzicola]
MRLSRLLSTITALLVGFILLLCGWLLISDERHLLDEAKLREIGKTAVVFSSAMQQAATLSASHAEAIAEDKTAQSLLKAKDRAGLQAYMKPAFDRLAGTADIDVLHFHEANMKSFLRVWEPENFGQDLSTFRPMVVATNHDKRTQKGLEFGIRGLSLRAMSPMLAGSELIGTVEVGVNLKSLTELAKSSTGADFALFLDPSVTNAKNDGRRAGALALDANTDTSLFTALDNRGLAHLTRAPYVETTVVDGRTLGVLGTPLIDYSGNVIGVIVVSSDVTVLERHANQSLVTIAAIALAGLLIVLAVLTIAIRATVVRPMNALTKAVRGDDMSHAPKSGLREYRALRDALAERLRATGSKDNAA